MRFHRVVRADSRVESAAWSTVLGVASLLVGSCGQSQGGGVQEGGAVGVSSGSVGSGQLGAGSGSSAPGSGSSATGAPTSGTGSGGPASGASGSNGSGSGGSGSGSAGSSVDGGGGDATVSGTSSGSGSSGHTGSAGSTCPGTVKAGDTTETIMSGGASRTFIVHVPTGYTGSSPIPVVFDFHPLGGTAQGQEQLSGWGTKCNSVGCIAVFPNSGPSDNSWNAGYCCSNSQQQKVDDVGFTRDMIKWLEANACVDPKRIYASGCSNGGGFAYRLACDAADVIAAVAPVDFRCVSGAAPANASSLTATNNTACVCTLARPISVTAFEEGQDNSIVPYNGGQTVVPANCPPGGSCGSFNFPSAKVNFGTWANFDMCTGSPTTNSSNSLCQTYTSCAANTEVSLCTSNSSSHCGSYTSSHIVDTAWQVFSQHPLP